MASLSEEVLDVEIKACHIFVHVVSKDLKECVNMGMVAITYKVMPDSDVEDVSAEEISEQIKSLNDDVYNVQLCEIKPLAFGLKFIQVHVVMNDGSGLSDIFEENMRVIRGTGEIEVLSMGLL